KGLAPRSRRAVGKPCRGLQAAKNAKDVRKIGSSLCYNAIVTNLSVSSISDAIVIASLPGQDSPITSNGYLQRRRYDYQCTYETLFILDFAPGSLYVYMLLDRFCT